ncbi:hypothetical protein TNCV_1609811 [Trichonephila clavipes]|nr:hypothetical protein TNCV_1609811 [Trichonephila clavipes]
MVSLQSHQDSNPIQAGYEFLTDLRAAALFLSAKINEKPFKPEPLVIVAHRRTRRLDVASESDISSQLYLSWAEKGCSSLVIKGPVAAVS